MFGKKWIFCCNLLIFSQASLIAREQPNTMESKLQMTMEPSKCVIVSEGRDCHADVTITWSSASPTDLCLSNSQSSDPLKCWENKSRGQFLMRLVSTKDVQFQLHSARDKGLYINQNFAITWIYEHKATKRRWRVF